MLKQAIENHPVLVYVVAVLIGFTAGLASYEAALRITGRVAVSSEDAKRVGQHDAMVTELTQLREALKQEREKTLQLAITGRSISGTAAGGLEAPKLPRTVWTQKSSTAGECSNCELIIEELAKGAIAVSSNNGLRGNGTLGADPGTYRGTFHFLGSQTEPPYTFVLVLGATQATLIASSARFGFTTIYSPKRAP